MLLHVGLVDLSLYVALAKALAAADLRASLTLPTLLTLILLLVLLLVVLLQRSGSQSKPKSCTLETLFWREKGADWIILLDR
jgi:hypothetical protein